MNKMKLYLLSALILLTVFVVSCDSDNETPDEPGFDRGTLLENLATELILPNFEELLAHVNGLSSATNSFVENSTTENLQDLRAFWTQAATAHQHCSAFGFGPANLPLGAYSTVLGVFPVDEPQVEANILDPDLNLAASFDRDVRGFYTVEYLIYGNGQTDEGLIADFDQDRKDYLVLVVRELQNTIDQIVQEWRSSYLQEFISDDGTAAGSSISLLYNAFVKDYENLKNFKVELPAGLTAGQAGPDATLVEGYYSGVSKDLLVAHFESSKNIWKGRTKTGEEFTGFDDYLNAVEGGSDLVAATEDAIRNIDQAIASLPSGPLSASLEANELQTLRDLLQANTANFKSSMSSLLGISITFNSGDGD